MHPIQPNYQLNCCFLYLVDVSLNCVGKYIYSYKKESLAGIENTELAPNKQPEFFQFHSSNAAAAFFIFLKYVLNIFNAFVIWYSTALLDKFC